MKVNCDQGLSCFENQKGHYEYQKVVYKTQVIHCKSSEAIWQPFEDIINTKNTKIEIFHWFCPSQKLWNLIQICCMKTLHAKFDININISVVTFQNYCIASTLECSIEVLWTSFFYEIEQHEHSVKQNEIKFETLQKCKNTRNKECYICN